MSYLLEMRSHSAAARAVIQGSKKIIVLTDHFGRGTKMNEKEFDRLKTQIEFLMDRIEELQQKHISETGKRYHPPLRLGGWAKQTKYERH